MVVISHERDLLNNVVDHILHLEGGKVTLYPAAMTRFERQRAERAGAARRGQGEAAGRAARQAAGLCRAQQRARLDRQAGAVARQGAGQDAADRR
jgi:ATP-binding cassette subfamily F protein 3